jgi:peptidyl-prolyl cis-trans isomerase C
MKRLSVGIFVVLVVSMSSIGCGSSGAQQKAPEQREALTEPAQEDQAGDDQPDEPERAAGAESTGADESPATDRAAEADDSNDADNADNADELPLHAIGPVAKVDGEEISADSFNKLISQRTQSMRGNMPPQIVDRFKSQAVDQLIDEHLVDQELAIVDVDVDAEEVEQEWARFKERFPNDEALESFMSRQDLDAAQFKQRLKKDLMLRKFLTDKYDVEVTEDEVRQYYSDNSVRFEQKEQVRARHILIKTDRDADQDAVREARERAGEVAAEAKEPDADFAELARKHSEGPTAQRGGDLGFFSRDRMVPEFADAAFDMQPGEISSPVKSQFGYHVIKVEARKKAGKTPFEEAKDEIVDQLERKGLRQAMQTFLAELKADADIERHEDNIEVNVDTSAQGQAPPGTMPQKTREQLQKQLKLQKKQSGE